MKKRSRFYPHVRVDTSSSAAVGQAGGVLLIDTVAVAGLDAALSAALAAWRKPLAVHDPGKVVLDLAVSLVLGGTAWPTSRCCARSPAFMAGWPRTRRSPARSMRWPLTRRRR